MFVVSKNKILVAFVLISCILTSIFCFSAINKTSLGDAQYVKNKILLDAGHGGIDGGVSGVNTGVKESDLNLKVVKKLEKLFFSAGFEVVLTRSTDAGLYGVATKNRKRKDMQKRKEIIEESSPSVVISVHMNKFASSHRRGGQVFYKDESEQGKILADLIQKKFNKLSDSKRDFDSLKGDYYILNCTNYPSVICECGFLSNPEEEALLVTEEYQSQIAQAIFDGVLEFLIGDSSS